MPRPTRDAAEGRFHHVFARGNRRQVVFGDDEDRRWFLDRLFALEGATGAVHLAHCLMRNHIHIVVRPGPDGISKLIQRLLCAYARWFNTRHAQVGHVFQDRFGSRPVTGDVDLLWLVRYVHRNPVEAGLVSRAELWPWSSHRDHLRPRPPGYLVGGARMLRDMLAEETGEAVNALRGVVDAAELRPIDLSAIVRTGSSTGAETGLDVPTPLARHPDEELRRLAIDVAARHALRSETSLLGTVRRGRVALARGEFCEEALRGGRHSLREVARFLGRSASTVSELARRGRIVKAASRNGGRSEPSPP